MRWGREARAEGLVEGPQVLGNFSGRLACPVPLPGTPASVLSAKSYCLPGPALALTSFVIPPPHPSLP